MAPDAEFVGQAIRESLWASIARLSAAVAFVG
jgi:hypothetical protein